MIIVNITQQYPICVDLFKTRDSNSTCHTLTYQKPFTKRKSFLTTKQNKKVSTFEDNSGD